MLTVVTFRASAEEECERIKSEKCLYSLITVHANLVSTHFPSMQFCPPVLFMPDHPLIVPLPLYSIPIQLSPIYPISYAAYSYFVPYFSIFHNSTQPETV